MATKNYLFSGTCKWAKVMKPDEEYENYQLPLYLDKESMELFQDSGCQLKVKSDEDGEFVTFKRNVVDYNPNTKAREEIGRPGLKIVNAEGELEDYSGLIGNGSEVTAQVQVYDSRNGKGHRLIGVVVNKLVEYNPEGGTSDNPSGAKLPF